MTTVAAKHQITLDPALLFENGKTAAFVTTTTDDGYWNVGTGARWKWSTVARRMEIDVHTTMSNTIALRVNDGVNLRDYYFGASPGGQATRHRVWLPPIQTGATAVPHIVELLVPGQHATALGGAPAGVYPVRVRADAPLTAIAVSSPTNRLGMLGDSITAGGSAIDQATLGFAGHFKRGLSYQSGTKWRALYAPATAYGIGDVVTFGKIVWRALVPVTGSTPAIGNPSWEAVGYNGSVTLWRTWGYKRVADDWSTAGDRTTNAAAVAAMGFTQLMILLGSNDASVVPPVTLANFTIYYEGMLDAIHAAQPALQIICISPILRGGESTMVDFRTAINNAVTARSGWTPAPTYVDGFPILVAGDLLDGTHPTTAGHVKMRDALLAAIP